jgi:phosphoesterase RecJ-like protein
MNRYHVSLRSDSTVDVAKIANKFGGGGHTSAAGFQIESTLVALKEKIIRLADNI